MPIYEYACGTCERTFEQIQRMSDPDLTAMIGCQPGECTLKRLISVCRTKIANTGPKFEKPVAPKIHDAPQITRQWMEPDGSVRDMKPGEYNPAWVGKNA